MVIIPLWLGPLNVTYGVLIEVSARNSFNWAKIPKKMSISVGSPPLTNT